MTLADLRQTTAELDAADPLAGYRDRFHIPPGKTYLCGNSLGLMPKNVDEYVTRELDAWRTLAVEGHFKPERPWVAFHELATPHLSKLVGAQPHEVVAMNTLTVNLHLMLTSFFRPADDRTGILVGHSAFPSDRYAISSKLQIHGAEGWDDRIMIIHPRPGEETLHTEDIINDIDIVHKGISLILMDGVNYLTGEFLDIPAITAAAHRQHILVGFDFAHAIGNMPLHLHDWNVDFAVWCSYKYLNGGPGAPAGVFIHEKHGLDTSVPRLAGWWGHDKATRFQMGPEFRPIPGAEGWQLSNPPLFSLAALLPSLELFSEVGMERLRAKSEQLTGLLETGLHELFPGQVQIITPADPARRGCQLSVRVAGGKSVHTALMQAGVSCDWREPDVIRIAPVPFYNRFADVVHCLEVLAEAVHA